MKLKSHSGTKKRVKITSKGKLMFARSNKRHLLINKSKRQKGIFGGGQPVHASDESKIRHLLPLSFKS